MKIYVTHVIQVMFYHQQLDYATHAQPTVIYVKRIFLASTAILTHYYKVTYVSAVQSGAKCAHPRVFVQHARIITTWFQTGVNLALLDVWLARLLQDIHALLARMAIF